MGCSSPKTIENYSYTKLTKWKEIESDIKKSITKFLFDNKINNIKLGFYEEREYKKKEKWNLTIKNIIRKVFILYEENAKDKDKKTLNEFLFNYFKNNSNYQIYNNTIIDNNDFFSPMKILNYNYEELLKEFKIKNNQSFISFYKNEKEIEELKKIESKNIFFKQIKNKEDNKYLFLKGYSLFFAENKLLYWIKNEYLNLNNINLIITFSEKKNIDNNYISYIKNCISKIPNDKNISFNIHYINYHLYNSESILFLNKVFPLIINSSEKDFSDFFSLDNFSENSNNKITLFSNIKPKINIINFIKEYYNEFPMEIKEIETFKEKKYSLITQSIFTYQKKFILKISSLDFNVFKNIIKKTKELNQELKKINLQYSIQHIIIEPLIGENFSLINNLKGVILLFKYSKCFDYFIDYLKEKYNQIFQNINFICFYNKKNNSINNLINNKKDIFFIDENVIKGTINCFFESLYSNSYYSHFLIILDNNSKISFFDFFKNSSNIYFNHLSNLKEKISKPLKLIDGNSFKEIKNLFKKKCENNFKEKNLNILEEKEKKIINSISIFQKFYEENIFYQPYYSLKYNKTLNKEYKNYTINIVDFNLEKEEEEIKKENELCKFFIVKDSYFQINEFMRCKICNKILYGRVTNEGIINSNLYNFYICPITKNIYCTNCYNNNENEIITHPFNLLYIKCFDKKILLNISNNNINYFKNCDDVEKYSEVKDNICEICDKNIYFQNSHYFYILCNIINRNIPFFICENCFNLFNDYSQKVIFSKLISEFLINNFIDLKNIIFKKIKI